MDIGAPELDKIRSCVRAKSEKCIYHNVTTYGFGIVGKASETKGLLIS